MVEIKLDLEKRYSIMLVDAMLEKVVGSAIQSTLAVVKDKWGREAQKKLHSTRQDYLRGLSFEKSLQYPLNGDYLTGAVSLIGETANALEKGYSAFDMKKGFGMSDKIKTNSKGGWYLTIPMRHGTPNTYQWGKPIPEDIYSFAKKLEEGKSLNIKGDNLKSWAGYTHKNNIYDGLTKVVKAYEKANQSQYVTFRRVSSESEVNSWMHPGFGGVKIAESLKPLAEKTLKTILDKNMKATFGGEI